MVLTLFLHAAIALRCQVLLLAVAFERGQVLRNKRIAKLVAGNRLRQQLGNAASQEVLLQNFAHRRPLLRVLDQHVCD